MKVIQQLSKFDKNTLLNLPYYRKNSAQEITLSLFTHCNLHCDFCYQNKSKDISVNFDDSLKLFEQAVITTPKTSIVVRLFGGELFSDDIPDDIFKRYSWFINQLYHISKSHNKTCELFLVSNLIHKKKRVFDLFQKLSHLNIRLIASFDLVGRFNHDTIVRLFVNNVNKYRTIIETSISVVATQENINAIVTNGKYIDIFEYLYDMCDISFDYYTYNDNRVVDEHTLTEFFKFLYFHYPRVENITALVRGIKQGIPQGASSTCPAFHIINNNILWSCCNMEMVQKKHCLRKRCFECSYYNICPRACVRIMSEFDDCHIKSTFDIIKNDNPY